MLDDFEIVLEAVRNDFRMSKTEKMSGEANEIIKRNKLMSYFYFFNKDLTNVNGQDVFDDYYYRIENKTSITRSFIKRLHNITEKEGIRFAVIKGISLNDLIYESSLVREIGDIDILVDKKDVGFLNRVLNEWGFLQKTGPTSSDSFSKTYSRARLALNMSIGNKKIMNLNKPIKAHSGKPQYLPYIKEGTPAIEIHDGIYYLNDKQIYEMMNELLLIDEQDYSYRSLSLEYVFIILILTAYQNSESFHSNSYDFGIILRDYVDIRFFIDRYRNKIDWKKVDDIINRWNLINMSGIIMNNYELVFGDKTGVCELDAITRKNSMWEMSIIERMKKPLKTRKNALRVQRSIWKKSSLNNPIYINYEEKDNNFELIEGVSISFKGADETLLKIERNNIGYILKIHMPKKFYDQKKNLMYQIAFYPLKEEYEYTSYKVDILFHEKEIKSFGRSTMRYRLGAVRKLSGKKLRVSVSRDQDRIDFINIQVVLPYDELGAPDFCDETHVVSAEVYKKHFNEIFHSLTEFNNDSKMYIMKRKS